MSIHSTLKELRKIMSKFLDDIETSIRSIHLAIGIDDATLTKEIANTVNAAFTPLQEQLAAQQAQIGDLQKALQDTVTALNNGDTTTAHATASAAVTSPAAAEVSSAANDPALQAVS